MKFERNLSTRKHSSRMCSTRGGGGGTVPGSIVWGGYGHGGGEGGTVGRHYPLPVDGQLRVKTLPSYNFVCGLEI